MQAGPEISATNKTLSTCMVQEDNTFLATYMFDSLNAYHQGECKVRAKTVCEHRSERRPK